MTEDQLKHEVLSCLVKAGNTYHHGADIAPGRICLSSWAAHQFHRLSTAVDRKVLPTRSSNLPRAATGRI
jgi:hypothetical protein